MKKDTILLSKEYKKHYIKVFFKSLLVWDILHIGKYKQAKNIVNGKMTYMWIKSQKSLGWQLKYRLWSHYIDAKHALFMLKK